VSDFLKLAGTLPADENRNGLDEIAAKYGIEIPRRLA
jgi:hypothetical protein